MIHELKTHCQYFRDIWKGLKKFEVRLNDRNFQVDDIVYLNEFDPFVENYTGRSLECKIIYLLSDPKFVKENYVIFSFKIITRYNLRMPKNNTKDVR